MTLSAFGLLILSILANLAVQFFLKLGADNLGEVNLTSFMSYTRAFATTPELLAGIAFSLISAIAYFFTLTNLELALAGPASSLIYVFSLFMGRFYFGESIVTNQYIGLGLIITGVILVSSK